MKKLRMRVEQLEIEISYIERNLRSLDEIITQAQIRKMPENPDFNTKWSNNWTCPTKVEWESIFH